MNVQKLVQGSRRISEQENEELDKEKVSGLREFKSFSDEEIEVKEVKPVERKYYFYPKYVQFLKDHNLPVSHDSRDTELTRFLEAATDAKRITKKVTAIVRLKNNWEGKGKQEYLIWYETWSYVDDNNNPIPSLECQFGVDQLVRLSQYFDRDGNKHFKPVGNSYFTYHVKWSPEKLDEILKDHDGNLEDISFTVNGLRTWGGFSYDEFRNLSFVELCDRGITGFCGYPVDKKTEDRIKASKNKKHGRDSRIDPVSKKKSSRRK